MKKYLFLLFLAITFASCEKSILDKPFYADYYEGDFPQLVKDKTLSQDDVFLINYTIVRQRECYGYDLDKKTYGEILAMGKKFQAEGLPIKQTFNEAKPQSSLTTKIFNPKIAYIEKEGNSKRKVKYLKFDCLYENTSDKPAALNYSTFIINGIFGQHLATVGYELNCKIPAGKKQMIHYVVKGKDLRNNLNFGRQNKVKRTMMDDVMTKAEIQVVGMVLDENSKFYDECFMDNSVIDPFQFSKYKELFPNGIQVTQNNGQPTIHFGSQQLIPEGADKVLKYK